MQPKAPRTNLGVKDKKGNILQTEHEVLTRWKEYISELYTDNSLEQYWPIENETIERINEQEMEIITKKLLKGKATGTDDIPAEFIQCSGKKGIKTITNLVTKIYETGEFSEDFLMSIFITIPKSPKAIKCEDHRTISLISHSCKILLNIFKGRITPLIESNLSESQLGLRKGNGTRNAIYMLRTISERLRKRESFLYAS